MESGITTLIKTNTNSLSPNELNQRNNVRLAAITKVFAEYEALSGVKADNKAFLTDRLLSDEISSTQIDKARAKIIGYNGKIGKYASIRLGQILYAHFYPTGEELAEVGYPLNEQESENAEYNRGYGVGYNAGVVDTEKSYQENLEYMRECAELLPATKLVNARKILDSREQAIEDMRAIVAAKDAELNRRLRRTERKQRFVTINPENVLTYDSMNFVNCSVRA
jgi:hypothetical protein